MKVLIWTKAFAPSTGGIERYSATLARGLVQSNVDVAIATETDAPEGFDADTPFPIWRRPSRQVLESLIRRADIVHLCGPAIAPMWMALRNRTGIVVEHSGYQLVCPSGMLLRYPDETICPNHFTAREHLRCVRCLVAQDAVGPLRAVARVAAGRIRSRISEHPRIVHVAVSRHVAARLGIPETHVIPHGIEVPEPLNAWQPEMFAFVGRLVREKGVDLLLDAFADVAKRDPAARLRIVGDGPLRSALEGQASALGIADKVLFAGSRSPDTVESALEPASTVVMPSRCEETFGLVALEQSARGRQVIASDIGGLAEVGRAVGARLVPPADSAALTETMLDAIRTARQTRPRPRLPETMTAEYMVKRHIQVYETVLRNPISSAR